jgi:hypothetical protein
VEVLLVCSIDSRDISGVETMVCYVQFFFEPEPWVVGLAETMRSPACLAMEIMKSWTSWRLTSAMLTCRLLSFFRGSGEQGQESRIEVVAGL